jgi:peptide chain release factor 1
MLSTEIIRKLELIEQRFEQLTSQLSDPSVTSNGDKYRKVAKERASVEPTVEALRAYRKTVKEIEDNEALLAEKDDEIRQMAKDELTLLRPRADQEAEALKMHLVPKDPNDEKDVILEIRAGAGGDEAGLFAAELMRMYLRFAERNGWKSEIVDTSTGNVGAIKDVTINIHGNAVYSALKYESGVHRVQRVPATETQGRIHTSTITVAVMPEAEEVDVQVKDADVDMQVMRSTGSGGQSVNTTDSAVRLTHKPSGVVVKCQQEKSQLKNRAQAMKMLRAKLYEMEQEKQKSARDGMRKSQVGTGDRSEKIRTYNFPQDRLTDHRVNYTRHNLPAVMDGDVRDMMDACRTYYAAEALREASASDNRGE